MSGMSCVNIEAVLYGDLKWVQLGQYCQLAGVGSLPCLALTCYQGCGVGQYKRVCPTPQPW